MQAADTISAEPDFERAIRLMFPDELVAKYLVRPEMMSVSRAWRERLGPLVQQCKAPDLAAAVALAQRFPHASLQMNVQREQLDALIATVKNLAFDPSSDLRDEL